MKLLEDKIDFVHSNESSINEFLFLKPYLTKIKTIAFYLKKTNILAALEDIKYESESVYFTFDVNCRLNNNDSVYLVLKKRALNHINKHNKVYEIRCIIKDSRIYVNESLENIHTKLNLKDDQVLDVYLRFKQNNTLVDYPIKVNNLNDSYIAINPFVKIKFYNNKQGNLCLYSRQKSMVIPVKITNPQNDEISIQFDLEKVNINTKMLDESKIKLKIKRKLPQGKSYAYYSYKTFDQTDLELKQKKIILSLKDLIINRKITVKETYSMFLSFNYMKMDVDYLLMPENDMSLIEFNTDAVISITANSDILELCIFPNENARQTLRVGVLGTCFSRNAFNSSEYFNPDYKRFYNCIFTQYHSSIISLVSNPVPIDISEINDVFPRSNLFYVENDFRKNIFSEIEKSNLDFLIIDFYADVIRGIIKLNDNQIVSGSHIFRKSMYFEKYKKEIELIEHEDDSYYFEIWKKACDQFIRKLLEVIPEEKIILNFSRLNSCYIDIEGTIRNYSGNFDHETIEYKNYFWDKLNNYFVSQLPNINILDMRDVDYIGDEKYPFGVSPEHYESKYYKEFLNRLVKIHF